jgi:ABC-type sugar transport system ATPase subunit
MDEPLINLNFDLKMDMLRAILETARETKASLIYVTHDGREAERLPGRTLTVTDGCIREG